MATFAPAGCACGLLGGSPSFADNVVVAGCDPAIHIVDERLSRERAPGRLLAWPMGSLAALEALKRGEVHMAGLHVVDPASGESNVPFVRKHLGGANVTLVTFAAWEAGLLVARGNPKKLRGIGDLARRGVAIVNREAGSGARLLLDERLRAAGVPPARVTGYNDEVGSHLEVGRRVAEGRADAGVGVEAIARLLDLGFVPVRTERYDLVIPTPLLDTHPGVARLLDALVSRDVRAEVESLGGYDTRETGRRIVPGPRQGDPLRGNAGRRVGPELVLPPHSTPRRAQARAASLVPRGRCGVSVKTTMRNLKVTHRWALALRASLLLFALLAAAPRTGAQAGQAEIAGEVRDTSDALVPGVQVTAVDVETGRRVAATTGKAGLFVLPSLRPGRYRLETEASGFRPHAPGRPRAQDGGARAGGRGARGGRVHRERHRHRRRAAARRRNAPTWAR